MAEDFLGLDKLDKKPEIKEEITKIKPKKKRFFKSKKIKKHKTHDTGGKPHMKKIKIKKHSTEGGGMNWLPIIGGVVVLVIIIGAVLLLATPGEAPPANGNGGNGEIPPNGGNGETPNPAAVYCQQQGGAHIIRTNPDGSQTGYCIFSNGAECDAWEYYRGDCTPTAIPFVEGSFKLKVLECLGDKLHVENTGTGTVILNSTTTVNKRGALIKYCEVSEKVIIQPGDLDIVPLTKDLYTILDEQNQSITLFSLKSVITNPDGGPKTVLTNFNCEN